MYQPVVLFICLRYMRGRSTDCFVQFISWISSIGIIIGVMALVAILSVMNGFEKELKNNLLELIPQVILSSLNTSINPLHFPKDVVKVKGVNRITPLTICEVVLQSTYGVSVGVMLGIENTKYDSLTSYLINVNMNELEEGKYNVILGEELSKQLSVNRGEQVRIIVPSVSHFTPMGRIPSQRLFNVIGTFSANGEVGYQMLVNIRDASRLMCYPDGNITGWRLWLNDPMKVDKINQNILPKGTKWQDWRDRKGELFQAIRMEKNVMGLFLSLIIVVSMFNIITSLSLTVMEKQREVAILKTQGLTRHQIMMVFMLKGASFGIIGGILGSVLGVILANQLGNLIPMIDIFFDVVSLPVDIKPLPIIGITLSAIIISLLSTIYPAWHAASFQPAKALHYE